ncbi:MAG TPA: biotin-independent malonate decarboxylase subunit gamma [Limnobacter sp.]|uniref:biotin-independent malonate decarboxylase subunit gamma n=1 Tax=Limnobacter sp. TaxID=2003368 RepID=UPI002ED8C04A
MLWTDLTQALFGTQHSVTQQGDFLSGEGQCNGRTWTVVGSTNHAPIGVELALAQARVVLDTIRQKPGQPILLLIDTQGQQLRHRDEVLGINRAMAHLGCCIDFARRQGHVVLGLVYDQALSGGFITSGLIADACHALPEAEIRVMRIPAMSRVTKISEDRLVELSKDNPVFAPGVNNYVRMGGVQSLWTGDLKACLDEAFQAAVNSNRQQDSRPLLGKERGGRTKAHDIAHAVAGA